jgi:nanoRNase/pAp phosphatase (c-di-AMP/oligoRNAs hydrolase)
MAEPAMKLTMVIEANQDPTFPDKLIPILASKSLKEIIDEPFVAKQLPGLMDRHQKSIEIIRKNSECVDGTILFDVTGYDLEGYNKFIPYYLYPESTYSIGLSKSSFRTKISVGSNPWTKTKAEDMVNLAVICERYGGGGHARVGAISFPPDHADDARRAAKDIVEELRASQRALAAKSGG